MVGGGRNEWVVDLGFDTLLFLRSAHSLFFLLFFDLFPATVVPPA